MSASGRPARGAVVEGPSAVAADELLQVDAITAGYGRMEVLSDLSFTLGRGEVLALLGPNGAGKTTIMRAVAGVVRPRAGKILLDRVEITDFAPYRRTRHGLCLVPEGRGVFQTLTVRENLRLFVRDAGGGSSALDRALVAFPSLAPRLNDPAGSLSGGQQQMLALSRAFVTSPEVILLDEVSIGLAPVVVDEIFEALAVLARSGVAMVLVEQYVNRALAIADGVLLLNKGAVVFRGLPSELDEEFMLSGYLGDSAETNPNP